MKNKKRICEIIFLIAVIALTAGIFIWSRDIDNKMEHYYNSDISYVTGVILDTDDSALVPETNTVGRYTGVQNVTAKVTGGRHKGDVVEIENYLTAASNVYVKAGQKVVISQDEPEGSAPYYLIYNYHRAAGIFGMGVLFCAAVILIGRKKGVGAIFGLLFTLFMVVRYMIPAISIGQSPVLVSIVTMILSTAVSLILLNGFCKKTLVAVLSTAAGVILVGIIFGIWSQILIISGFNTDEAEFMIMLSQKTKLSVAEVLFAGVLIASLGAVMDVGMSLASALREIVDLHPETTQKELIRSGLHIGKDMIGTMSNTLILAFTGTGLGTLLVLTVYGIKYNQFINSDFLAIEVCQGISGTMAIVMMVPITSAISAFAYIQNKKRLEE